MKNKKEYKNTKIILIALSWALFMIIGNFAIAQTTETLTSGTSWTVPCGVTSVTVEVWAGGGGGGGDKDKNNTNGGIGGTAGGYSTSVVAVTPGNSIAYNVGGGGAGGGADSDGSNGGNSNFSTVTATGGTGGAHNSYAGPGGSDGGTVSTAYDGTNTGAGGTGATTDGDGGNGTTYGGGGGGGYHLSAGSNDGGDGAPGAIRITYTAVTPTAPTAGSDQTLDACETTATLDGSTPDAGGTGTWTVSPAGPTFSPNANTPGASVSNMSLDVTYTFTWTFVYTGCTNQTDDVDITTSAGIGCWNYCTVSGTQSAYGHIANLTFGSINRTSTYDGYINTGLTTNVVRSSSYDLDITFSNSSTTGRWTAAWIDWNNDGDFLDTNEEVMAPLVNTGTGTQNRVVSVTVPATAILGNTKMRVVWKYQGGSQPAPTACDAYNTYIDWEDYTINVLGPPSITTDPTNQSVCYNSSADFNVAATGIEPFTYQWKYQGSNVVDGTPANAVYTGATSSTLSVSGTMANATYSAYTCVVSNTYGNVTSAGADLIISSDVAPAAPTDLTISDDMICDGTSVTLGATVSSGTLEWYSASCDGTLETSPVSPTETTAYFARAFDSGTGCRSACSNITVNVLDEITFVEDPEDQYGCAGESLTFSIIAIGAGLTYQWQEDSGSGFGDITDAGVYSGATTMDLVISDVTGLDGNDYRCVVTGTCDTQNSASATLSEISTGLTGTYTIGTGGGYDYLTLKAAFDDINTNGLSGDTYLELNTNVTEGAEASLNEWIDCAGNSNYSVTIYPTGATRTISGSIATSLVTLNGADNVTIDGRIDMTGTANSLVFTNTSLTGSTVKLINDACNNTISYATLRGASEGSNGVVFFSTADDTGNDYNTINECDIRDAATTPLYGIYAVGSAGSDSVNNDNTISNCNVYNFWKTASYTRGIHLGAGNTRWTITGNSIYQTVARLDAAFYGISIANTSGGEFSITENYIGGRAPLCAGTALTYSSASYAISFEGMILYTNSVGISLIKDNVIKNIDFTSSPVTTDGSQVPIWTGIDIYAGRIDVLDNTIGDGSTGSINVTIYEDYNSNGGTAWNNGVWHNGEGNVIGNTIGSISFAGTISTQCGFNAIEYVGTTITDQIIADNVVGHETTASSISFANAATPAMTMGGVYFGTDGDFLTTVSNNTIANIYNGCTAGNSFFVALNNQASDGSQIIIGNSIHDITTASAELGSYATSNDFPAFAGIRTNNIIAGKSLTISNNSIHSISSTNASANITLFGIFCATGTTGTHVINANIVHSFSTLNTSTSVTQNGVVLNTGNGSITNNMVRLGISGINTDNLISGIETQTTSSNSVLFNSVYVGGTATSNQNSTAFYRNGNGTADVRNNIFVNARTGGTGTHYACFYGLTSNLTSDYNIYSDNAGGVKAYAGALRTSLAAIQTGTGQDGTSQVANPLFINPIGAGITCDLHIPIGSPAVGTAVTGTGVTTDYDSQERIVTGPCIGADENVTAPYGTDVYGIYIPDAIDGIIEDIEVVSQGGAPGGTGYDVADPNDAHWPNVNISAYQVITASNLSCTNSEFTFTTADGTPSWLFGNGSDPSSSSSSPSTSTYESTGYKDLIESVKVFSDFNNITLESPDPGSILGAPSGAGCPTTYTYTSSVAGSAGYLYDWACTPPSGCIVTIDDAAGSSTDITFVNQTGVDQIYLVTLDIETECCGPLRTIERYITIYPGPTMPDITGNPYSTCTGGTQDVSINAPNATYSHEWFDAETGGTQLGSGTSYTFDTMPSGTNYYYVQSTNSFGCSSQRTEIEIEGVDPSAPSVDNETTCGDNDVTLSINSPTGSYIYLWYTGSCGGTLLQAGTGANFTYNVTSATTFYVAAIPPGCDTSVCATPSVTYNVPTDPILWEGDDGADPNNWFVAENWQGDCIPTCATNVSIPNLANDPDIGFDPTQVAKAHDINFQTGAILSFSDNKAILQICGDFTHAGTLTTNDFGAIEFTGSTAQSYINSSATGEFNNVKINNTGATPTVTITGGDMVISTKGILGFVNGTIVTGTNKLVVKNTASIAIGGYDADRYIDGNLRRHITTTVSDYPFPVGVASRYALVDFTNNSLTGLTYLDVKFLTSFTSTGILDPAKTIDGTVVYDNLCTEGVWQIDADASPTGGSYDISLWFNDGGFGTFANLIDNQFAPVKRSSASTLAIDWTAIGGTGTLHAITNGYGERTGWGGFSQYAVAYKATPLPVELLDFGATYNGKTVDLEWLTMTEINNDFFLVEKSDDARNFLPIGKVLSLAPDGNSNSEIQYFFNDKDIKSGTLYYRLKQYDFDGAYDYSNIATIIIGDNGVFTIMPNPARDIVEINYYCTSDDNPIIKIYDDRGRIVLIDKLYCTKGQNFTTIDISKFAPGTYMVVLTTSSEINRAKLIKH